MALKPVKHIVLYKDRHYNSFPNIVVNKEGTFVVAFRQAPDRQGTFGLQHVDPSSRAVVATSADGETWSSEANVLYDDFFYGVQDPCLNVLADGTMFATCFMWKVAEQDDVRGDPDYDYKVYNNWLGKRVGSYTLRSADGGLTWDRPLPVDLGRLSIRGNAVELAGGSLLVPFYSESDGAKDGVSRAIVGRTDDRGVSWTRQAVIEPEQGYGLFEPNLYRTPSGKIVLFARCHKRNPQPEDGREAYPLVTAESLDDGLTWSAPVRRPLYSPSPFHPLRLRDGRVLLTYGYRFRPYGIRAVLLDAECERWAEEEEEIVREDGHGGDIGYTCAAQLHDGRILIVYYYSRQNERERYIAGTLCELANGRGGEAAT
ncbi:sialidase family protein [Paenibacillus hemerocallicola]|uniref:sialidase family protein n=1 Tax=Paenibacillus hemerocallicola TaxID=1172614 RepID=UPI00159EC43A|nr:sialidase family protein [Paenibacillus hemerocallicola]